MAAVDLAQALTTLAANAPASAAPHQPPGRRRSWGSHLMGSAIWG